MGDMLDCNLILCGGMLNSNRKLLLLYVELLPEVVALYWTFTESYCCILDCYRTLLLLYVGL